MSKSVKNAQPDLSNDPEILQLIKNEHKYTIMLLAVLREQLADFDIGKTPDYALMYDIVHYMSNFPKKFNNPAKINLIQAIIEKDPENNSVLETLLAEKKQIAQSCNEVIKSLKGLLKEETILKEEQLKIFCKNFIELIESHIEIESQLVFSKARNSFSTTELNAFEVKSDLETDDNGLGNVVEDRYKKLSGVLSHRWENIEEAANEFAFAEFVGMGALFETIEPLSIGLNDISKIVKEYSYKLYLENYNCYKELLSLKQEDLSNYIEKPLNCMQLCYKEYISSIDKIVDVMKNTKKQIVEPYESRRKFYKDENKSTTKEAGKTKQGSTV